MPHFPNPLKLLNHIRHNRQGPETRQQQQPLSFKRAEHGTPAPPPRDAEAEILYSSSPNDPGPAGAVGSEHAVADGGIDVHRLGTGTRHSFSLDFEPPVHTDSRSIHRAVAAMLATSVAKGELTPLQRRQIEPNLRHDLQAAMQEVALHEEAPGGFSASFHYRFPSGENTSKVAGPIKMAAFVKGEGIPATLTLGHDVATHLENFLRTRGLRTASLQPENSPRGLAAFMRAPENARSTQALHARGAAGSFVHAFILFSKHSLSPLRSNPPDAAFAFASLTGEPAGRLARNGHVLRLMREAQHWNPDSSCNDEIMSRYARVMNHYAADHARPAVVADTTHEVPGAPEPQKRKAPGAHLQPSGQQLSRQFKADDAAAMEARAASARTGLVYQQAKLGLIEGLGSHRAFARLASELPAYAAAMRLVLDEPLLPARRQQNRGTQPFHPLP